MVRLRVVGQDETAARSESLMGEYVLVQWGGC